MSQERLRGLWTTLAVTLSLSVILILGIGVSQAQPPEFRIGVLDSEDGPITLAARYAVAEINAVGGLTGADGTNFNLSLVVQGPDDEGNLDTAIANIGQARVIAVLGPLTTQQVRDNLTPLQNLGVPILTPALGDTLLASDNSGLLFRSRAAEVLQGRALAAYLVDDLGLNRIVTVQLAVDIDSTAAVVGFSTAASAQGAAPISNLLYDATAEVSTLADDVVGTNPEITVIYGSPELAGLLYLEMLAAGYDGQIAYPDVRNPLFAQALPFGALDRIISTSTWSLAENTTLSQQFVSDFLLATGRPPTPISVATIDSFLLIEEAIAAPGELDDNLRALAGLVGIQGELNPANLSRGETSDNVVVLDYNALGGTSVVARFAGNTRIPVDDSEVVIGATPLPTATATPDGVIGTVVSERLNVRTGPGLVYDVLGQLSQGDQVRLIGGNAGFSWAVIQFRGQQAWISTQPNLLDVFGDPNTLPIVAAPATPTPSPPTETPVPNLPDIVVTDVTPTFIPFNQATTVTVTVRNAGGVDAGPFAVATSFLPGEIFASQNISGLAAGASTTFQLTFPAVAQTGNFEAVMVADLNNQLNEGTVGENNNFDFVYEYRIDRASTTNIATIGIGSSIALDGGNDITFSGVGLETVAPCTGTTFCLGLLSPTLNYDTAFFDAITSGNGVNASAVPNISLTPGATIGILTSNGTRGVIRIDNVQPGVSVSFTYRLYQ